MSDRLHRALKGEAIYTIAEIGTNHGASLEQALRLVDACAEAGADAVKFQSWKVAEFQNPVDLAAAGSWTAPSGAYPVLERYELPDAWHAPLLERCRERGVDFLSTPFDVERVGFLVRLGVPAMKISSSDLVYPELLEAAVQAGCPILLSTGMGDLAEVRRAVDLVAGRVPLVLLHCVAGYPPAPEDANLRALPALAAGFGLPVGWSDHFTEDAQALAAVALGAVVIEKHVTLDRAGADPDSPFATTPAELRSLVERMERVRVGLGDGIKRCAPSEANGLIFGRRGIYARRDLAPGETLTRDVLKIVRPCRGEFAAADLSGLLGRTLRTAVPAHHPITRAAVD